MNSDGSTPSLSIVLSMSQHSFMEFLAQFHLTHVHKVLRVPALYGQPLDLHKLYIVVHGFGGYYKVTAEKEWDAVVELTLLSSTCAASIIQKAYENCLLDFEVHMAPEQDPYGVLDSIKCPVCGDAGNEEDFVLCDGANCQSGGHYRCLNLTTIPDGDWFCDSCKTATDGYLSTPPRVTPVVDSPAVVPAPAVVDSLAVDSLFDSLAVDSLDVVDSLVDSLAVDSLAVADSLAVVTAPAVPRTAVFDQGDELHFDIGLMEFLDLQLGDDVLTTSAVDLSSFIDSVLADLDNLRERVLSFREKECGSQP
jgi:hypothetical protein